MLDKSLFPLHLKTPVSTSDLQIIQVQSAYQAYQVFQAYQAPLVYQVFQVFQEHQALEVFIDTNKESLFINLKIILICHYLEN